MPNETVSVTDALSLIADKLETNKKYSVGSFWEFTRDVWSQGFDHPEYFKAWHVATICEDIEECLENGKHYVGILPRAHFKSTILGHAFSVWRMLKMGTNANILYLSYSDTNKDKYSFLGLACKTSKMYVRLKTESRYRV